ALCTEGVVHAESRNSSKVRLVPAIAVLRGFSCTVYLTGRSAARASDGKARSTASSDRNGLIGVLPRVTMSEAPSIRCRQRRCQEKIARSQHGFPPRVVPRGAL